jgi:hypothetical protein
VELHQKQLRSFFFAQQNNPFLVKLLSLERRFGLIQNKFILVK